MDEIEVNEEESFSTANMVVASVGVVCITILTLEAAARAIEKVYERRLARKARKALEEA